LLHRRTCNVAHAAINTFGVRVYHEQQGDRRFVGPAVEIAPPVLRPAA